MPRAKVLTSDGEQTVRLPAEFRLEGDEVEVRRDPVTGDVILSQPARAFASWDDYGRWVETLDLPEFPLEREQPADDFRAPLVESSR